eukprot:8880344-Lingulodinium_polyedra.AAC.1
MQSTPSDHVLLAARVTGGVRRRRRSFWKRSFKGWWPARHCGAKVRRLLDALPEAATAQQLQKTLEQMVRLPSRPRRGAQPTMQLPDVPQDVLDAAQRLEAATLAEERKDCGKVYHRARRRWRRAALIRHEA